MRRWIALLPWAVPAISLAALPAVAGAVFAPAAGAATFRVAPSTARVPLSATATLPAVAVRELGGPRPLLGTRSKSPNWSGYDVTGGPFTSVTATWTQPRVRASSSFFTDTAFWVGLDGDSPDPVHDPPRTVEQIGTEGFSLQRVYYDAWYEMYPANYVRIPMAIHPGDVITASVTWAPAAPATDSSPAIQEGFTLTLVNSTTNKSFATFQPTAKMSIPPERSSVEVIAEAPSLGDGSVLPLADFGLANFHGCAFDGQPISAFDWSRINMVSWDTNRTEAATSALSPDGTAFSVTTDLKRPVTTVSGAGARWYGKPVTLRFRARDNRGRHRRRLHAVLTRSRVDLDEGPVGDGAGPERPLRRRRDRRSGIARQTVPATSRENAPASCTSTRAGPRRWPSGRPVWSAAGRRRCATT